jgi:TRAP-type C4-dicarboxylate transport system permease small subunit
MSGLRSFEKVVRVICLTLGVIAAVFAVAMMAMITADVLLRNVVNSMVLGSYEMVEYLMLATVCGALGVTQINRFHICVTVAVEWMPKRWRAFLDCVTFLMMLTFFGMAIYLSFDQTLSMLNRGARSPVLMVPRWPFQAMLVTAFGSLWLAFFKDFLFRAAVLVGIDDGGPRVQEGKEDLKVI